MNQTPNAYEMMSGMDAAKAVTAMSRAVQLVDRLQPFPTAAETREQIRQHIAALAAQEPELRITEVPEEINLTPRGCMTAEGNARVAKTMQEWEATHAEVANAATNFFHAYEDLLMDMSSGAEGEDAREDLNDLRKLIADRERKQEAFLRAVAGAPQPQPTAGPSNWLEIRQGYADGLLTDDEDEEAEEAEDD